MHVKDTKMGETILADDDYDPAQKWRFLATGHHWPHLFRRKSSQRVLPFKQI
jgi:hypothetical protein